MTAGRRWLKQAIAEGRARQAGGEPFDQKMKRLAAALRQQQAEAAKLDAAIWEKVRNYAISQMTGISGRQRVPTNSLDHLDVPIPPLSEQHAIAHILGTLDDKIELNRRMSETLEGMARAIFKSWFVDFDPVRAKAEGRDPGLSQPVACLFPARLVDSELGEIPEGWEVTSLPDVMEVNPTQSLRRGEVAPYLDFLQDGQVGWGSTEYIVLHPKPPLSSEFAYCLARSSEFRDFAIQSMTGSSGRQRVPAESLSHFLVVAPPEPIAELFGRLIKPLFSRASAATKESRTFAALRDALLRGEIRVRDAERFLKGRGL